MEMAQCVEGLEGKVREVFKWGQSDRQDIISLGHLCRSTELGFCSDCKGQPMTGTQINCVYFISISY